MNLRRILVCAFGASLLWALAIRLWGGFSIRLGTIRISSRRYETALAIGVVCLAAAFTPIGSHGRRAVQDEWRWWWRQVLRHAVAACLHISRVAVRVVQPVIDLGVRLSRYAPTTATVVLIGVAAVGTVVRWIPPRSLWLDEEFIAINLRDRSFGHLAGTLWFGQSAPYGWMVLERATVLIAGTSEQALRLVPTLCFLATMVVAFVAGRRWLNSVGTFVFVWCCAFGAWTLHYAFEVKPYTADALGALSLSVLTAWALDAGAVGVRRRRVWIWWTVAAVALWFAYGALWAAPGCAVVLVLSTWRRDGWRSALGAAAAGLIWLGSFAACFLVSLRFSLGNQYLHDYWLWAFPPAGASFWARWVWLGQQLRPLAENPGSTTTGFLLWIVFLAGLLTARRPRLAILAAAAPLSAFALGWLRVVPLHDRLALWMTPQLYLGVALLADRAATWAHDGWRRRTWRLLPAAAAAALASGWIVVDLGQHRGGFLAPIEMDAGTRGDAAAVRSLLASHRPGDVIVSTHMGWPAVWWYGGIAMSDEPTATSGHLPDGTSVLELSPQFDNSCDDDLSHAIARSRRTLIYVGFPDVPPTFEADLRQVISRSALLREGEYFAPGRVWIVEPRASVPGPAEPAPGCMSVRVARRW